MASSWIFKVIVAGAGGVGKTAMITRYCTGEFEEGYKMTIGAGFHTKSEELDSGESIKMQLWENADLESCCQIIVRAPVVHLFVLTLLITTPSVKFQSG